MPAPSHTPYLSEKKVRYQRVSPEHVGFGPKLSLPSGSKRVFEKAVREVSLPLVVKTGSTP